jgi:hypothetical protein
MYIENSVSTQYNVYANISYASAKREHIGPYIDTDVCMQIPGSINGSDYIPEEPHRCVLLQ